MDDLCAVTRDGLFVHRRAALSIPRQNGKSWVVIAFCLWALLVLGAKVAYTAHNYSTVCDIFDRFKRLFGTKANDQHAEHPELNSLVSAVRGTTSREAVVLKTGAAVHFSTRTDSSLRGQSFDILVVDEAQELTDTQQKAILATTNAGPLGNPLTVYIGTPPGPEARGTVFRNVRESALGDDADDILWLEWGADEVGDVWDRSRWYECNPSLGTLSDESSFVAAAGSSTPLDFAQEYLGYWLPRLRERPVIDASKWEACRTDAPPSDGVVCYAAKFSPDGGRGCVAVALKPRDGGPVHVEIAKAQAMDGGVSWAADWIAQRLDKAACVVVDGKAHGDDLAQRLRDAGAGRRAVVQARPQDVAAACSLLVNSVAERSMTHFGQSSLNKSATETRKRQIGNGGGFGFDAIDDADPTLVEAAALALWASKTTKRDPERRATVW